MKRESLSDLTTLAPDLEKHSFVEWFTDNFKEITTMYGCKTDSDNEFLTKAVMIYVKRITGYFSLNQKALKLLQNNDIQMPLLSLLFVFMDQMSWLRVEGVSNKVDYLYILDKYITPFLSTDITSGELYSARNGLIHTH